MQIEVKETKTSQENEKTTVTQLAVEYIFQ